MRRLPTVSICVPALVWLWVSVAGPGSPSALAAESLAAGWAVRCPAVCGAGPSSFVDARGYTWALLPAAGYQPPPADWVREALGCAQARFGGLLDCAIYLLPAPRAALPRSSCDGWGVYISPPPGRPFDRAEFEAILFHELGHVLERQRMSDRDSAWWRRYREVRGITDERFRFDGPHANRPQEIFAEDVRCLFGTDRARRPRALETCDAPPRERRPHLRAFFLDLLRGAAAEPAPALAQAGEGGGAESR